MKKFLTLALLSLSSIAFVPSAEAKPASSTATAANAEPQIYRTQRGRFQRRTRTVTTTRTVRRGRSLYRETYRTTYFANGRVNQRLISRVLVRRY